MDAAQPSSPPYDPQTLMRIWSERVTQKAEVQAWLEYRYPIFLVLFALGAALLLAWVFWPRGKRLTRNGWEPSTAGPAPGLERFGVGICGAFLLLILTAVSRQADIDNRRGFIQDIQRKMEADLRKADAIGPQAREEILKSQYLYLPEGGSLRQISLGNPSLAADYLWLSSLQYVSSAFRQGHKFDLMSRFYDGILELDPDWVEIEVKAGKILSALDPNRTRTEEFLNRAMIRNPDTYLLPEVAGQLYVVPPNDPRMLAAYSEKASEYFRKALTRRRLPPEERAPLEDLIARLKMEAGRAEVAAEYLWKVANDSTAPEALRERSSHQWLQADAQVRVDRIQGLVKRYQAAKGRFPSSLRELFQGRAPLDTYGFHMEYDPGGGTVISHGIHCARAIQVARIIENLVASYGGQSHGAHLPKNLAEFTQYLRRLFRPPNDAPFSVRDALGNDLDCTRNPLGPAWDYNPQTGKITLPPECAPQELFRNRRWAMEGREPPAFETPAVP